MQILNSMEYPPHANKSYREPNPCLQRMLRELGLQGVRIAWNEKTWVSVDDDKMRMAHKDLSETGW